MSSTTTKKSKEELAKLGIHVETPELEILGDTGSIDLIGDTDLADLARDEKFMQDILQIRVATTTDQNAPPFVDLTVNDVTNRVRIPRGRPVFVKRLHVEVLARMRETRYTQPTRNPMDPEIGNQLIPSHSWAYPFEVLKDPNPLGREWLEVILNEPTY